ncbi:MAG: RsmD family RNA methyltransferase, partial [Verrucomicrobiota bacterium]
MRIITGSARGMTIQVPPVTTRPTTDRVREAIFSSLGPCCDGAKVLDLFAGSGSLGLEALSRGAESAIFVEESRKATAVINKNLKKTKLEDRGEVVTIKAARFIQHQ